MTSAKQQEETTLFFNFSLTLSLTAIQINLPWLLKNLISCWSEQRLLNISFITSFHKVKYNSRRGCALWEAVQCETRSVLLIHSCKLVDKVVSRGKDKNFAREKDLMLTYENEGNFVCAVWINIHLS